MPVSLLPVRLAPPGAWTCASPAACACGRSAGGNLWAAWFTGAGPSIYAAVSTDDGATFGPRQPIAVLGGGLDNARRPEIGALPDGRLAVIYQAFRTSGVRRVERDYGRRPAAGVPR